ncbi:hypothetical protein PIB30_032052 [Stylosanthes scabra]|uniref:Uncharacterized protein n=1 Tax=Stylosanthes scabra TaxID=79078 RepID=A0ABU6ZBL9_9FABA|nr:hypothetical protein [Stylosanthes scabra]
MHVLAAVATGCYDHDVGEVMGFDPEGVNYTTGCLSTCLRINDTTNGVCNGDGCCQSPIPAQGRLSEISYVSVRGSLLSLGSSKSVYGGAGGHHDLS